MKRPKEILIVSPHDDDGLINCFEIMNKHCTKVVRGYDFLKEDFNFYDEIYIPSFSDYHPTHKKINAKMMSIIDRENYSKLRYYSTDRIRPFKVLSKKLQVEKEANLDLDFPDKKELWKSNRKYILFESNLPYDGKKWIVITDRFEGIHHYPGANNYLRFPHRHLFHIKITIEVFHDDREIEFIQFKNWVKQFYPAKVEAGSCEMIADDLMFNIRKKYSDRHLKIEVYEDGENGGIIEI